MAKMRITFCLCQMITGGVESCLFCLLSNLIKDSDFEINIVTRLAPTNLKLIKFFKENETKVNVIPIYPNRQHEPNRIKRICKKLRYKLRYKKRIKRGFFQSDLIVDYTFFTKFYKDFSKKRSFTKSIPKILFLHESLPCIRENLKGKSLDFLAGIYDKVICLTQDFKSKALTLGNKDLLKQKLIQMYDPIDVQGIQKMANTAEIYADFKKYFTFIARMSDEKDHETVILAFHQFLKKNPEGKLYLIGDGPTRIALEKLVERMSLKKSVFFTGSIENPMGFLKEATANLLSSNGEGLGMVLIEAQCLKVLNIASDCPNGPREILLDGEGGMLFPAHDIDALAHAMHTVWNEPKANFQGLIENSFEALDRFDSNKIVNSFKDLVRQLLGKG